MRLESKVCIITGSARGLGRAFALQSAKEGARLTVYDVFECKQVVEEIEAIGGEILSLKTDTTSETNTTEMARKTFE